MDDIEVYTGPAGEPQRITKKMPDSPASPSHEPHQEWNKMHDKEYEKAHGGVVVEQHDHDHNYGQPGGMYPGYAGAGGFGLVWGLFGLIIFLAILWGIWSAARRNEEHHLHAVDKHHDGQRCMDKIGYEQGYIHKQLADMQYTLNNFANREENHYETELRWGMPYGLHTQPLCTAKPQHCAEHRGHRGGGIINGSQLSETATFAVDHSVI